MKDQSALRVGASALRLSLVIAAASLLLGCAAFRLPGLDSETLGLERTRQCTNDPTSNAVEVYSALCHAAMLRASYGEQANALNTWENAATLVTIGAALTAAATATFEWHNDLYRIAGLSVGAAQASSLSFSPGDKRRQLVSAINALSCVTTKTRSSIFMNPAHREKLAPSAMSMVANLVSSTIATIESETLRAFGTPSDGPDRDKLLEIILAAVKVPGVALEGAVEGQLVLSETTIPKDAFDKFAEDIGKCAL